MWFISVEVEQETSAPPPNKKPGSAPAQEERTCPGVFLVLMLMSTQFSLADTCACAYVLAKTRLKRESTITDVFSKANENSPF